MAKALTVAAIEKLKPDPAKRREIADGGQPNLYFIIQPSGAKSWALRFRLRGEPCKYTVGSYPTFGLTDARAAARSALQAVADGRDPTREREARRQAEATDDTFAHAARLWVERYARKELKAWPEAARVLGFTADLAGVKPDSPMARWGDRKLTDIRKRDVLALFEDTVDRAPYTANRQLAWTRRLFNWLIARDMIAINPCQGLELQAEKSRDRVLSDDELKAIWLAAGELGWPFGHIIKLLALTGARREEIRALRWSEVHDDRIELSGDRTKNGEAHIIPLSQPARDVIQSLHKVHRSPLVFPSRSSGRPVSGFAQAKERLDKLSGVADWRVHDLRRTFVTGLQRLAVRYDVAEACVNHLSGTRAGVAGVYRRYDYASEKRAALDTWARHVTELIEGRSGAKVVELNARR